MTPGYSTAAPSLRLRWIIKKIILWVKLSTAVKETNRKRHSLAVNSLAGPCGACVHTQSSSLSLEKPAQNKSKLIVMHFPSAKKFNYDGCDSAIQASRIHYWLVPLRLKCTAPEETKDGDVSDHHVLHPHLCVQWQQECYTNWKSTGSKSIRYFSVHIIH